MRRSGFGVTVAAWLVVLCLNGGTAAANSLEPFFGSYTGVAEVQDSGTGSTERRDMDIVIEPYQEEGFRVEWVNVTLVDGRRDLPGVARRVQTVLFEPAPGREFYVEAQQSSPFREREATLPMRGDPVRWAAVEGKRLQVFSFVVLEDGRYELQVYDRILTDQGLDIDFRRLVDGRIVKRITGSAVRANISTAEG
jgi:hypothetical protein